MNKSCICFIADENYLLPTLVAASQAAAHSGPDADILTLLISDDRERAASFRPAFAKGKVELIQHPRSVLEGRHIMHARLNLDRLLPDKYEEFLYLDSDVQVMSSLEPLLLADLEHGSILAAPDPMSMIIDLDIRIAEDLRRYFASIGFSPERLRSYFNSGVIRARRDAWKEISSAAMELTKRHGCGLRFPDQDVLNLVAGDAYRPISVRWNFPAFFLQARLERQIAPSIIHFMSNPRPWHGPFLPWGHAGHRPYREAAAMFPELSVQMPTLSSRRYLRLLLQQIWKRVAEAPTWRGAHVRERLLAQESCAYV